MPIDKYLYLRKAAEVEEIVSRIQIISDINAAFSGNNDRLVDLQKIYTEIIGYDVNWKSDYNWEDKLKHYASVQK
jgi:hypothetical protein